MLRTKPAEKGVGARQGFRWRGGAKYANFSGIIYPLTLPVAFIILGFINGSRRTKLENKIP